MITRDKTYLSGRKPDPELLAGVLREHDREMPRLLRLGAYYGGGHDILRRERRAGLPNTRLPHGYPAYITRMAAGYLIGCPVRYECADAQASSRLNEILARADAPSVDAELAQDASIYGKAVEVMEVDESGFLRFTALPPTAAFAVYSDDPACEPLLAVLTRPLNDKSGRRVGRTVTAYTRETVTEYRQINGKMKETSCREHFFRLLPVTEYWNNARETGDFEGVLPLIDAYDTLQSDRVNDKQQFADALLVLTGVMGIAGETGDSRSPGERLRQEKTLSLPDSTARVEWLTKEAREADTDVLRQALENDIHKFSMVPDLTDESFSQNESGVAMKYKLLGLEQMTNVKERFFREGLLCRLRLIARFLSLTEDITLVPESARILFTRSLPANEKEMAETVSLLHGIVPDEQLLPHIPFLTPITKGESNA